jgi:hypothetical protein
MSAKEHQRAILVEKRSRALAMMLLSRRQDLLIEEVKEDIGLDYVVRFQTKHKEGLREFGIAIRGAVTAASKRDADKALRPALAHVLRRGPFLRPVCLCFFTMENDGAWYTWVAEPITAEDGTAVLWAGDEPDCHPLDKRALTEIIERVDVWYDAIFPRLIVNGPGGRKANREGTKQ